MKKKFILTERFYALMITLIGLALIPICKYFNDGDITSVIVVLPLGILNYISTFFEDEEDE